MENQGSGAAVQTNGVKEIRENQKTPSSGADGPVEFDGHEAVPNGNVDGFEVTEKLVKKPSPDAGAEEHARYEAHCNNVKKAKESLELTKKSIKHGLGPEDYAKVVDTLDQVCIILKKELGEFEPDTLEALFYYGSALLESYQNGSSLMSSKANQVIRQYASDIVEAADKLKGIADEAADARNGTEEIGKDEDEDEEDQSDGESLPGPEDADENMLDVSSSKAEKVDDASMNGSGVEVDQEPQQGPSSLISAETEHNLSKTIDNDEQDGDDEDEDAVTIAELKYAFEILETAHVGYDKLLRQGRATHDDKLRMAEIHYKLALCQAENGQQAEALIEAERAVRLCEEICVGSSRDLAEAYFNYGTLLYMYSLLTEAADNLKKAVAVLETRKAMNEKRISELKADPTANSQELLDVTRDQQEITGIIPDIVSRLEETMEDANMSQTEVKRMLKQWMDGLVEDERERAELPKLEEKPVNDIGNLVRRKRATEDISNDEAKKVKSLDGGVTNAASGSGLNVRNGSNDASDKSSSVGTVLSGPSPTETK